MAKKKEKNLLTLNYGGQEYKLNGEQVLLMSQNEVLSIIEDKDE